MPCWGVASQSCPAESQDRGWEQQLCPPLASPSPSEGLGDKASLPAAGPAPRTRHWGVRGGNRQRGTRVGSGGSSFVWGCSL